MRRRPLPSLRRGARRLTITAGALLAVGFAVIGAIPSAASATTATATPGQPRPNRVLILSLPDITWDDISANGLPNLHKLLADSAVADLSTRSAKGSAQLGDGYATINAGTRASTDHTTDGDAFEPGEAFGNGTAGEAFRQRTGHEVDSGLVHLGIAGLIDDNADLLFDAKVGDFGDALAQGGFSRAVVANADGTAPDSPPTGPRYRRTAVTALIGSEGTVPAGAVGRELLERDANAPFGVRLDIGAADRAFNRVWKTKSVVLVEASDLVRADAARSYTTSNQRGVQLRRALAHTDALVGTLLRRVDLARDAVVVVGPSRPSSQASLTIAAVHAPGYGAGLLKSGTTRRAGFVSLPDVAPTVLEVIGVDRPETMEGRAMKPAGGGDSFADRVSFLVHSNEDGLFRDRLVGITQTTLIVSTIVFAIAAAFFIRDRRARVPLQFAALVLIGFPLATFFASRIHFAGGTGVAGYWAFVAVVSLLFPVLCRLAGRRGPLDPLIVALGAVVVIHLVDLLTGTHLEFNSVFGYSPTVGIRFSGLGNLAFAELTASAVILAGLLVWRFGRPVGTRLAIGVLAVSVVVIASPLWGQDFGGTLAATPAFALLAWMLLGRRVTVRTVFGLIGLLIAGGLLVGFLDLLRPSDERTHVGRFFEKVGNEGWSGFVTVLHRKGSENADTLSSTGWILLIAVVVALVLFLWFRRPDRLRAAVDRIPTLRPCAVAFVVVAALGYALNDSGVAIPAVMMGIAGASAVYISTEVEAIGARPDEPEPMADRELTAAP